MIHELCSLDVTDCSAAKVYPDFTTSEDTVLGWFRSNPSEARGKLRDIVHAVAVEITFDIRHKGNVKGRRGFNMPTSPHGILSLDDHVAMKTVMRPEWELTIGVTLSILYWDLFGKAKAGEVRATQKGKGKGKDGDNPAKASKGRLQFTRVLWRHPKYIGPRCHSVVTLPNRLIAVAAQDPRDGPSEAWTAKYQHLRKC
jgi:hypothetical protein